MPLELFHLGQPNLISRSGQSTPPILGDFRRVGLVFGSCSPYDAVCFAFRAACEFRVYVRDHFAHTIHTDLPIRLARPPHCDPTQTVDRISRFDRAGLTTSKILELSLKNVRSIRPSSSAAGSSWAPSASPQRRPAACATTSRQGLTLLHFSAQPEPFLTQNTP